MVILQLLKHGLVQHYHDPLLAGHHDLQELAKSYRQVALARERLADSLLWPPATRAWWRRIRRHLPRRADAVLAQAEAARLPHCGTGLGRPTDIDLRCSVSSVVLNILLSLGTPPKIGRPHVPGRLPSSRHPSYHPAMPSQLFAAVIATLLLVGVVVAEAQQAARQATIGVLSGLSREERQDSLEAFRRELRALGWEEGKNLSIEERYADGDVARLPALSEELVQRKVEIIVVSTSAATSAAMRATNTIPIVMVDVGDPLTSKFVSNLARPGGNVTGTTNMALGLTQKRLEILKEALPSARRIAMMLHPESVIGATLWRDAEIAARHLGLRLQRLEIRSRDDLRRAFQAAVNARADAMVPLADPLNAVLTDDILDLAARYRLPTMMEDRGSVDAGALLAYYSDPHKAYSRVASYVARILDGTKPGELPVEQPTTFELAINLKTAKALGLDVPATLLARADEVIE